METRGDKLQSSTGSRHSYTRRLRTGAASLIVIGGAIFMGGAVSLVTAYAHSGVVATSENCSTWSASVTLNHNVSSDRWVGVISTIPGSPGFAPKQGYDSSFGLIWSANGAAPKSGMVTLNIFRNNNGAPGTLEFTASGSIAPPADCKFVPHITTTASAGGPVGTVVSDIATITGGMNPTGTVTFKLYASLADCNAGGSPVFTALNKPLSTTPPLTATSGTFMPTSPGHYNWVAHYNGDANNMIRETKCGDEPLNITTAAPSITTTASAGGQVPVTVSDIATVSGGASPTGTVTFTLYPDLASCNAGTGALFTSAAVALSGGSATSGTFSLTTAGAFQWIASYSGDANNAPISSTCGDEPVVTTTGGGGVLGITTTTPTPNTGSSEALSGLTLGGFLALAGLGLALAGAIVPRRNRI